MRFRLMMLIDNYIKSVNQKMLKICQSKIKSVQSRTFDINCREIIFAQ